MAIEIKVQNTNGEDDDDVGDAAKVERRGLRLSPTTGCPAAVTFTIGTTTVKTSATTVFDDVTCATLANGALVEVDGNVGGRRLDPGDEGRIPVRPE